MKEKDLSCFGLVFTACSVLGRLFWKIVLEDCSGLNNLPSTEQAVKTKPKQDQFFAFIFHHF